MNSMLAVLALAGAVHAFPSAQPRLVVRGEVKETADAGAYTYVLIATQEGDRWAAVVKAPFKKGAPISVVEETVMENFESKVLGRKFDRVIFGALEGGGASDPHAGLGKTKSEEPVKPVAKAEGPDARTVSEVFSERAGLKGKSVSVRGRVVRFTGGIMGSNWIHLQDGSGSAKTKDNDLVVTTKDAAKVGEVVTADGPVALDKDLGSGYFFPVLVEGATLAR